MSQSKSILMPFIIIAALLFGVAVAWKTFQSDTPEPVKEQADKSPVTQSNIKTKTVKKDDIAIIEYEETKTPVFTVNEMPMEERKKAAANMMDYAMKYNTEEKALKAMKTMYDLGQNEKLEHLIMYAERYFPDLEVPTFD